MATTAGVAVIVPWAAYNTARFEEPVFLRTELGVTLRIANTPTTYRGEKLGYADYASGTGGDGNLVICAPANRALSTSRPWTWS